MMHEHHHHGHGHSHSHSQQNAVSRQNEEAFDEMAPSFETVPWIVRLGQQMTKELQDNIQWIRATDSKHASGKLLDYACGSGTVPRALAEHYETLRGIDLSAGMLKEFNRLAEQAGYNKEKMKAVRGDLLDPEGTPAPELARPEYFDFDTATMTFAMHHVEDVETMLRRLVERVHPGGTVLIVDLVGVGSGELLKGRGVVHGGFTEDQMKGYFDKVGLENWGWKLFAEEVDMPVAHGGPKTVFMARGVKPASSEH